MPGARRIILGSLLLLLAVSGCDCEARVRNFVSRPSKDEERVAARTELVQQEQVREVEPNDSPGNATPIVLRKELRAVHGALASEQDVDWFSVATDEPGDELFELIVTPLSSALDIALYLEVPGSPEAAPLLYDVSKAGQAESVPVLSVGSVSGDVLSGNSPGRGPLRFFVAAAGKTGKIDESNGAYKIEFRRRLAGGIIESEPNDFVHLATKLKVPGEIQGFYDRPRDQDIYYVAAEDLRGAAYRLELSNIVGLTQQVRVYAEPTMEEVLFGMTVSAGVSADIPSFSMPPGASGLWFVLTAGDSFDRERGYRLKVTEHLPVTGFALETEPNNTVERAQLIVPGVPIRGYLHDSSDIDRFRFVIEAELPPTVEPGAEAPGVGLDAGLLENNALALDPFANLPKKDEPKYVFQARLKPLGASHRPGMRWITAAGEQTVVATSVDESIALCNLVVEPGTFDVEVRSAEMTDAGSPAGQVGAVRGFDYELMIENLASTKGLEIEPNHSIALADRLEMGQARVGYISQAGDVDVFAFAVGQSAQVVEKRGGPTVIMQADGTPGIEQEAPVAGESETESQGVHKVSVHLEANALNLEFELIDDEGGQIATVNRAGAGADEKLSIELPAGLYFVVVKAERGFGCDPYRLTVRQD